MDIATLYRIGVELPRLSREVALVLCVTSLLCIAGASPVAAQSRAVADPRGDVAHYDYSEDDTTTGRYELDIVGVKVRHTSSKVIFSTTMTGSPTGCFWCNLTLSIDGNSDRVMDYYYHDRGIYKASGREVICNRRDKVDDATFRVIASRSCFDNPGKVRFKSTMYREVGATCCSDWYRDRTRWTEAALRG